MDLESYTAIYSQTHPAPSLRRRSPLTDWRFWLLILVVGGGILVSGIRTQAAFLDLARVSGPDWLPVLESVAAALVSEVGIVAFIVEGVQRRARRQPLGWIYAGLVVCFAISASANFDQGSQVRYPNGLPSDWELGIAHVALLSVGIPVIVALTAEALGQYLATLASENAARVQEWEEAMAGWHRGLQASWTAQQRRDQARADRVAAAPTAPTLAVATPSGRSLGTRPTPTDRLPPLLVTHLTTIGRRVGGWDGNGSFQRKDVEAWLGVGGSQANNILKQAEEHGYVSRLPGYRYQLTSITETTLPSAATTPNMEEAA
ncbi:MAG: hypothetical protein KKA73_01555 [Chloroflexi bacterium]|nr:hypothetical protein [Chloroflexota bacterium]MBU1746350.1 hypothetical protein [Chloroflexota bacterium]